MPHALFLLPLVVGLAAPDPDKVAEALVKAFNADSTEDVLKLCHDDFRKAFPVDRLRPILRQVRDNCGSIKDWSRAEPDERWLVYHLRGESKDVLVKFALDDEGRIAGLTFAPPKAPSTEADKVVTAFIKAFNDGAAEEAHRLLTPEFRKALPLDALRADLDKWRGRAGKITATEPVRRRGDVRTYRAVGDKRRLELHVVVTAGGLLGGLRFAEQAPRALPAGTLSEDGLKGRLRSAVEHALAEEGFPSMSLAVVRGDRLLWAEAFGFQNLARKVKADPETVYVACSVTKVLTATAVMQLVDEGKLDLDAPVNTFLKELQIANPFEKEAPLTARHLLSHRGGIPTGNVTAPLWSRRLPPSLADLVQQRVRVTQRPGERFRYSNFGYALAGHVLAELTGRPFEEALRDRLLQPAGMNRSAVRPTPDMEEHLAVPYTGGGLFDPPRVGARLRLGETPAGELYTTASDLARFLLVHLNGGTVEGRRVLSPESVKAMATRQFEKDGGPTGLGWILARREGRPILWHNGQISPGFCSYVAADPEKRYGVVLLANKDDVAVLEELAQWAMTLLDKLE
jgi:CubicO group peptidase (beta-lactamase class C family)